MIWIPFLVASLAGINFAACSLRSYDEFKVYSVQYQSMKDVEAMHYWEHNPYVDFWSSAGVNKTNNVMVDPSMQTKFEEFLSIENFNYEILIENVGKLVELPMNFCYHPSPSFLEIFQSRIHQLFLSFSIRFRSIKSHTRNKLKFHFRNGNFTDTAARDFSHYWTLPEVT